MDEHPFRTAKHFGWTLLGVLAALFVIRLAERTIPTLGPIIGSIESGSIGLPTSSGG